MFEKDLSRISRTFIANIERRPVIEILAVEKLDGLTVDRSASRGWCGGIGRGCDLIGDRCGGFRILTSHAEET